MNINLCTVIAICFCLAATALGEKFLIPVLKSHKMGQKILDIGPRWHKGKEDTPTMGGLVFLVVALALGIGGTIYGILSDRINEFLPFIITIFFAILNGCIGIADDLTKFKKERNEGLTPLQKLVLQVVLAAGYVAIMAIHGFIKTSLYIPYLDFYWELGFVYYFIAIFAIVATVNCANLTDGIDGLASSVMLVIGVFFATVAISVSSYSLSLTASVATGCAIGFLIYNFYPARVFMGDTGSLFFGAIAVGCSFILNNPLIIVIAGIIYVAEGLSDIIQIFVYKLTHKRIFKMAPIHHHFEKCGWSELRVVGVFTLVTAIACVIAWFGIN